MARVISMKTARDCGPVAIANYLAVARDLDPATVYIRMIEEFGFPNRQNILDDLWDSPARHVEILTAITGEPCGIPDVVNRSAVYLVHLGGLRFHWVVLLATTVGSAVWHDGVTVRVTSSAAAPPVGTVVFVYALGGKKSPARFWRAWKKLTDVALLFARKVK